MKNYIANSLAPWTATPWQEARMEELFNSPDNSTITRLTFSNGTVTAKTGPTAQPGRTEPVQKYFSEIATQKPDLNLTIYICTADHPELVITDNCPFFTFAKTINSRFILIPDQFFTSDFSKYHRSANCGSLDADVDGAPARSQWAEKKAKVVFRSKDFKYAGICKAALDLARNIADVKISGNPENCIPELSQLNWPELAGNYDTGKICGGRMDIGGQLEYKYLLHTPACWDSTYWKLRSNSLLFSLDKVYSRSKDDDHLSTHQWYYYFMEPFKHYIPCTMDDLAGRITWAGKHDGEARRIADEGSKLAKEVLTYKKSQTYVGKLLEEFALIRKTQTR